MSRRQLIEKLHRLPARKPSAQSRCKTSFGEFVRVAITQFDLDPTIFNEQWGSGTGPRRYRSPWQNGHVERLIGSIRRECTNHLLVFNVEHLRRILSK